MRNRVSVKLYVISIVAAFIAGGYAMHLVRWVDKDTQGNPYAAVMLSTLGGLNVMTNTRAGVAKNRSSWNQRSPLPNPAEPAVSDVVQQGAIRRRCNSGSEHTDMIRERLEALIQQLDPSELAYAIRNVTGMNAEQVSRIQNLAGFASQLAQVAMNEQVMDDSEVDEVHEISFTKNVLDLYQGKSGETYFDGESGRIYAMFPTSDYNEESVLMKWYRLDMPSQGRVKMQPIMHAAPFNYVWAELDVWQEARYRVEIYSASESLKLLAAGEYEVTSPSH